jgi:hypothetical protein
VQEPEIIQATLPAVARIISDMQGE